MKKLAAILALVFITTLVLNMTAHAATGWQPLVEQGKNKEQIVKADDKKPPQQKPDDKKPPQQKPDDKKPPQQKPDDKKPPQQKPDDKKPPQQKPNNPKYPLCSVKNCSQTGDHKHNNKWYGGHHPGDGHNWHKPGPGQQPPKK